MATKMSDSNMRIALIQFGRETKLRLKNDDIALKYLDERIKTLPKDEIKKMYAVLQSYRMTKSELQKNILIKYIETSFSVKRWLRQKVIKELTTRQK